jgi:hypothetical protein
MMDGMQRLEGSEARTTNQHKSIQLKRGAHVTSGLHLILRSDLIHCATQHVEATLVAVQAEHLNNNNRPQQGLRMERQVAPHDATSSVMTICLPSNMPEDTPAMRLDR